MENLVAFLFLSEIFGDYATICLNFGTGMPPLSSVSSQQRRLDLKDRPIFTVFMQQNLPAAVRAGDVHRPCPAFSPD